MDFVRQSVLQNRVLASTMITMYSGELLLWRIPENLVETVKDPSSTTQMATLPETNIAPENRLLEKEIPIGNHLF